MINTIVAIACHFYLVRGAATDLDWSLTSIAIAFPLTYLTYQSFGRREKALENLAGELVYSKIKCKYEVYKYIWGRGNLHACIMRSIM
jgi:hypothetical protein